MPDIYEIEKDGEIYEVEANSPEQAVAALSAFAAPKQATPLPEAATAGMMANSTAEGGDPGNPRRKVFGRTLRDDMEADVMTHDVMGEMPGPPVGQAVSMLRAVPGVIGKAPAAAKAVPGVIARGLGISKERAGANIGAAVEATKDAAVNLGKVGEAVGDIMQYDRIQKIPMAVRTLAKRMADTTKGPVTVEEARRYYPSISEMTAEELTTLKPQMRRLVGKLREALNSDLVESMGEKGAQYASGMKEYARASKVAKGAKRVAQATGLAAGGDYLLRRVSDAMRSTVGGQ